MNLQHPELVKLLKQAYSAEKAAAFAYSEQDSSLVKFSDLSFKNDSEKNAFNQFGISKDKSDVFELLFTSFDNMQVGEKTKALQKIDNSVAELKKSTAGKSDAKKIKIAYDYIHKEFLKVYKLKNSFIDIFQTGEYNCVSASALYALIFSKLEIPYQIKELPTHVYLIAYPNSSKIVIETTSPTKGYYQFSNSFITKYVTFLYDSKIITKEELESSNTNDLFNKHYFSSDNVSIHELAGLQYSNFAIYFMDDDITDLVKAKENAQKACFLFSSEKHRYLLKSVLMNSIEKTGYDNSENIANLALLCRYNNLKDKELNNDVIIYEFGRIIHAQLIKNSDFDLFEKSYNKIIVEIKDSLLKGEITYGYNYELLFWVDGLTNI